MIFANFVRAASLVDEDIYKLSPDEKILIDNNSIPQLNPSTKSSLIGEGKTAKVYKVLHDGKIMAAKVSENREDITSIYKLYLIKKELEKNPETQDLSKHIMDFYGSYQGEVVEDGKVVTKYIGLTELLTVMAEDISVYFAYSNLVKALPKDVRKDRYLNTVDQLITSIKNHFEKTKKAYSQESLGVYYDLFNYCLEHQIDINKQDLLKSSKEINNSITNYLNLIESKTFDKIETLSQQFRGTSISLEQIIKSNLLYIVESKFINRPAPKFFNDIFYDESDKLVKEIVDVFLKNNLPVLAKDIENLLEPLIMKSLEIFLTGINLSYKSKINTLKYFEHIKELNSFIKLLNYLIDNNLAKYEDLHHYNVMIRDDSTLVLSDPGSFEF